MSSESLVNESSKKNPYAYRESDPNYRGNELDPVIKKNIYIIKNLANGPLTKR